MMEELKKNFELIKKRSLTIKKGEKEYQENKKDINNNNIQKNNIINNNVINNNEMNNLRKELEDEKKKNKQLQDTINNLNNTINQIKQEHYTDIQKYKKENAKLIEKNKELEKLLDEKNNEINDYIFKLNNTSYNEQLISVKTGDKIIAVLFMTQGSQDIYNYTMACKTSDLFVRLEERLYHDFPKYRNYETFFMVNARKIFRFKTLEENNIKNNDIISLFINE